MFWHRFSFPKKYFYLALLLLALLLAFLIWRFFVPGKYSHLQVKAGDCLFTVEAALEPAQQYRGLSDRPSLDADKGMLFLFSPAADETFVMRKMNFPLDIIFIRDYRVVNLYHDAVPEGKNPETSYHSGVPVDAVLEVKAGRSRDCRLGVGSEITW
ncbi:MAG: DUF192 domain-containing protein [Patescibacteria group bacterium]|nr:DUF192 domain-containing protein [Patescibacteria group bacterium]